MQALVFLTIILGVCCLILGLQNQALISKINSQISQIPKDCPRPMLSSNSYSQIQYERRLYEALKGDDGR